MTHYYLGIDGGGSNCRARLESAQGELLGLGHAGPANVATQPQAALANIESAYQEALNAANLAGQEHQVCAVLGLAGYNLAAGKIAVEAWQSPFANTLVTTDMHIACVGAHGGSDGAIIILGTGSSAVVCQGDHQQALGGFGLPLGDQASGAWLGLHAVQQALLITDGIAVENQFLQSILNQAGASTGLELAEVFHRSKPADFARLAPTIIDLAKANNPQANLLINQAVEYIEQVIKRLQTLGAKEISLVGGLAQVYEEFLPAPIKAIISRAKATPLQGATLLAQQKFNSTSRAQ